MKINAETKYCQTCGIPLDIDYTNLEANQNVEYCDYCLHNGVKLYDFSMDYLIYLWGLFPEEYYKETGVNLTSEELRTEMSKRLPNIKRWKQKINTAHVQYDLIISTAICLTTLILTSYLMLQVSPSIIFAGSSKLFVEKILELTFND